MGGKKKGIHFMVDQGLYEKFHRIFPGVGEKSLFFRKIMQLAVARQGEKDAFIEGIWEDAEEMYGGREEGRDW